MRAVKPVRIAPKAVIIEGGRLLVVENVDKQGVWYMLPGGGQQPGETLSEALQRECLEEIGAQIEAGLVVSVRDYIANNHEFAEDDTDAHQVEIMFECRLAPGSKLGMGSAPDSMQTGVAWLALERLGEYRLYPAALKQMLVGGLPEGGAQYLGDVN